MSSDIGKLALQLSVNPGAFEQDMLRAAQDVQQFAQTASTQLGGLAQPPPVELRLGQNILQDLERVQQQAAGLHADIAVHANAAPFVRDVETAKQAAGQTNLVVHANAAPFLRDVEASKQLAGMHADLAVRANAAPFLRDVEATKQLAAGVRADLAVHANTAPFLRDVEDAKKTAASAAPAAVMDMTALARAAAPAPIALTADVSGFLKALEQARVQTDKVSASIGNTLSGALIAPVPVKLNTDTSVRQLEAIKAQIDGLSVPQSLKLNVAQAVKDVEAAQIQLARLNTPQFLKLDAGAARKEIEQAQQMVQGLSAQMQALSASGMHVNTAGLVAAQQQASTLSSGLGALRGGLMQVSTAFQSLAGLNLAGPINQLASLASTLGAIASTGISGFTMGIIAAGGALVTFAGSAMKAIAAQAGLAKRFSITTEAAAGLQFAASRFGVDQETLSGGMAILARRLGEIKQELNSGGGGEQLAALRRLNIDAAAFLSLPMDQQLAKLSQGLISVHDPLERAEIAFRILGRQAEQLEPLLRRGEAAFADSARMARQLGVAVNEMDARHVKDALAAVREAGAFLASIVQSVGSAIGIGIAPAMQAMASAASSLIVGIQPALQVIRDLFRAVAEGVSFVVTTVIDGVSPIAAALGTVMQLLGTAWSALKAFFGLADAGSMVKEIKSILAPIVSVVTALGLGMAAIYAWNKAWALATATMAIVKTALAWVTGATAMQSGAMAALTGTTAAATRSMIGFKAALVSTGVGALLVGVGLLVNAFTSTDQAAVHTGEEIARLRAIAAVPVNIRTDGGQEIAQQMLAEHRRLQELRDQRGNTSGASEVRAIDRQIEATNRLIAAQQRQLEELDRLANAQAAMANVERTADINAIERAAQQAESDEERLALAQQLRDVMSRPVAVGGAEDAARLAQSINQSVAALREQAATAGMSADEIARWRLQQQGATAADLARVEALQQVAAAAQDAARLNQDAQDLSTRQQDAIDTFGMTAREAEIARLEARGLNAEKVELLRLQAQHLEQLEAQAKLEADARRIAESVISPIEKQAREQANLDEMVKAGLLSQDEYDLAVLKSIEDLDKATGNAMANIHGAAALEQGSSAAVSAVNKAILQSMTARRNPNERVEALLAAAQAKQDAQIREARDLRRAIENIRPPVI